MAGDDNASLTATIASMGKAIQELAAEVKKRPATSALEMLIGLPANPLALPPASNGTYPVLVTALLHPHLLPDVITQIGDFKFPPANLGRLLKTASVQPPQTLHLVVGPTGLPEFTPSAPVAGATALLHDVPDVLAFAEAWGIFMLVLQNERLLLPIAQALSAHLGNIIVLACAYPWPTVLDYHVAFIQKRALDPFFNPIFWMNSDSHLHTVHLLTPSFRPVVMPPETSTVPEPPLPDRAKVQWAVSAAIFVGPVAGLTPSQCAGLCSLRMEGQQQRPPEVVLRVARGNCPGRDNFCTCPPSIWCFPLAPFHGPPPVPRHPQM
ncbi:hypothetical protein K438DRAFT_1775059 [Mycena galopus ATCC 62051]|nr:hypothetical protein K438DRAFT_1775059 [Mycena galopus ATCC 62051]